MEETERQHIFWSFRRCPFAMRARLAVCSAGIRVELREILLRDKPAAFLRVSSKATVPVLELEDGRTIEESRDIMFWALERGDPHGWLDPWHRHPDRVRQFLDHLDGPFKHHLDRYKYASRYDAAAEVTHRREGADFLARLDQDLRRGAALSGARLGLLDFACLPFVRQFRIADPGWFDRQPWPHLHRWLAAFLDSALFAAVMSKYQAWTGASAPITFPAPQP